MFQLEIFQIVLESHRHSLRKKSDKHKTDYFVFYRLFPPCSSEILISNSGHFLQCRLRQQSDSKSGIECNRNGKTLLFIRKTSPTINKNHRRPMSQPCVLQTTSKCPRERTLWYFRSAAVSKLIQRIVYTDRHKVCICTVVCDSVMVPKLYILRYH